MRDGESRFAAKIGRYQVIVLALAGAVTIAIAAVPALSFGYRSADLHVALETAACLVSILAAWLLYGRFRRSRMLDELALAGAMTALAAANLVRVLIPAASDTIQAEAVWSPLLAGLLAATCLAVAAFAPRRPVRRPSRGPLALLAGVTAVAAAAGAGLLLGDQLGTGIDPAVSPASSNSPRLDAAAGVIACQLGSLALLTAACWGFARRARSDGDELLGWISLAVTVAIFARVNYLLFPSAYSEWVFTGDIFRLASYLLILIGAARQISAYERSARRLGVLEERRRIARDMSDGLAQDLTFISSHAADLARDDPRAQPLAVVATRALADSRGAIAALSTTGEEGLEVSVARLATALTHRTDIELQLDLAEGIEASQDRREALLRILSASIESVIQHGSPSTLSVGLSWRPGVGRAGLRLTIGEDGGGFDPADANSTGRLGLSGMRERVERLGGTMRVTFREGAGTEVEVSLP